MLRPIQVRQHVNFMRSRGYSIGAVLANSGIEASRLSEPDYLVEVAQCHAVVANMIRLTGNPGIGLDLGRTTNLNDLGIVGYAMASSNTLGQAIGIWLKYSTSPVGFPFSLTLIDTQPDGRWGVKAVPNGVSGSVYRFYVEETLAMGMSFGELLTGMPFRILEADFAFPAPQHLGDYERQFRCPITFNAGATRVMLKSPRLDTPVRSNDSELRELCIRHCSHLVRHIARNGPVASRLRSMLTHMGTIPALEAAAEALNMSQRSLRRHLQQENTSFQSILDEFRCDLAREYLVAGMMPAKEVGFLLGFSHVDAFRRAFRAWTGQTVGEFQSAIPPSDTGVRIHAPRRHDMLYVRL